MTVNNERRGRIEQVQAHLSLLGVLAQKRNPAILISNSIHYYLSKIESFKSSITLIQKREDASK
jgi:hypothetical protein